MGRNTNKKNKNKSSKGFIFLGIMVLASGMLLFSCDLGLDINALLSFANNSESSESSDSDSQEDKDKMDEGTRKIVAGYWKNEHGTKGFRLYENGTYRTYHQDIMQFFGIGTIGAPRPYTTEGFFNNSDDEITMNLEGIGTVTLIVSNRDDRAAFNLYGETYYWTPHGLPFNLAGKWRYTSGGSWEEFEFTPTHENNGSSGTETYEDSTGSPKITGLTWSANSQYYNVFGYVDVYIQDSSSTHRLLRVKTGDAGAAPYMELDGKIYVKQ